MLLRNTKKFFQKTLKSFKSLFSSSSDYYQKMPRTYKDHDRLFTEHISSQQVSLLANNNKEIKPIKKRVSNKKMAIKKGDENGSFMKFAAKASQPKKVHADSRLDAAASVKRSEERRCLLTEMLKEIELMDMNNVDLMLDIEEFLHYYCRITCPAYVDIVDKFFLEICSEFFGLTAVPARVSSRPKLRS